MRSEARLLAFESWMVAATRGDDWFAPLRDSAKLLGARAVLITWTDYARGATTLSAGPEATPDFVRLCRDLASAEGESVLERAQAALGSVSWTKVETESEPMGQLSLFALAETPVDHGLIREIAAVAASSVATKARLNAVRATSALKTEAFDQLPFGVVIVDKQVRIVERNEGCRAILARADGLNVVQGKLMCREQRDQSALLSAVARALGGDLGGGIVKVHRARGAQPYVVRVVASRSEGRDHCLLMIVDPDEEPSPGCDIWRMMFDLTECELIIAEGLVSGRRINDIANQRGVSIETVRTQTKRMFERLNVSSQAEAAARLSRTAPFRLQREDTTDSAEVVA